MGSDAGGIEGRLSIDLLTDHGAVSDVAIRSSRPLKMPLIFKGKSVEHLLDTLPLLYSVCGTAQAVAAVTACEQALDLPVTPACRRGRELLVAFETAKEHTWRIFQDWAQLQGIEPLLPVIANVTGLMGRFRQSLYPVNRNQLPSLEPQMAGLDEARAVIIELQSLLEQELFPQGLDRWLAFDGKEGLVAWTVAGDNPAAGLLRHIHDRGWESLGANPVQPLPPLDAAALDRSLTGSQADEMIARPLWHGKAYETTPYTRMAGHPLLHSLAEAWGNGLYPRLVARLLELAQMPGRLLQLIDEINQDGESVALKHPLRQGVGLAQVEAARGRLVHRVELDGRVIAGYQILAPTEWNFHPQGVLVQALKGLAFSSVDSLRHQAALLINAIDPCVAYELNLQPVEE